MEKTDAYCIEFREPGHDPRGSGRYETADFDTLHLNLRQRKLILITENNKVILTFSFLCKNGKKNILI